MSLAPQIFTKDTEATIPYLPQNGLPGHDGRTPEQKLSTPASSSLPFQTLMFR